MHHPSAEVVIKLARVLGLDQRELFFLANPGTKALVFQHPESNRPSTWDGFAKDFYSTPTSCRSGVKPHPDPNVVSWLADVDEDRVFISVASFAEIRRGIELMPAGRRRERLGEWATEDLPARFEDRILRIDQRRRDLGLIHGARTESRPDARVDGRVLRCRG